MKLKFTLLLVFIVSFSWSQTTKTFATSGAFQVPNGVTNITVKAWGAGGSGGGAKGAGLLFGRGAAGGGGGAYASSILTVTPGAVLNVVVGGQSSASAGANGTAGGNSTIAGYESLFLAAGGSGGGANNAGGTPIGGTGGTIAASAGTTKIAGCNGHNGTSCSLLSLLLCSGAGGDGANFGGAGGTSVSGLIFGTLPGNFGAAPGGGGSGAINSAGGAAQAGGKGGAGQVIISYTCPTYDIASATATDVCVSSGTTATVTVTSVPTSLPVGNYWVTYNRSSPNAVSLTANMTVSTAGTGTFTATGFTTLGASTITVTKITSESCSSNITANNTATITVYPETVGGTVSGGTTIISGNTSGLLTLSGHTGSIIKWQSSVSPFTTWTDIANTTTTYTSGVLTATTQFRAVVQSGTCVSSDAAPTTVTVEERPTISLETSAVAVCSSPGAQNTTLNYSGTTESPVSYSIVWNSSPTNSFAAVTDAVLPLSPITIAIPGGTGSGVYSGTLTVKKANGTVSTGSVFDVVINKSPTFTTRGVIHTICASNNPQNPYLDYDASTGNPTSYAIDWDDAANAAFLADVPDTPNIFTSHENQFRVYISANALPGFHYGRIIVSNQFCTSVESYPVQILISRSDAVGGAVTGGTTVVTGSASGLLTLSGHTGSVLRWQSSVAPFTTWTNINTINTTYTSGPLTETTQFRAVIKKGFCFEVNSEPTTVTVVEDVLPIITVGTPAVAVCSNAGAQNTTLSYGITTGFPVSYSIVWDSSPANGFVSVTDAALPVSPITIAVPAAAVAGTYTGTLTVKNASGLVSSPNSFILNVSGSPSINAESEIAAVTTSNNLQYTTLAYSQTSNNPVKYSIDWNSVIADQPETLFSFSPGGGVINNIEIPANVPAGTYEGKLYIINDLGCTKFYSLSIKINPLEALTITALAPAEACVGRYEDEVTAASLFYSATGAPVTYSIVWNSSPANNFEAVTDAELPAGSITIYAPGGTPAGTYTGTLTVKNASGTVSSGSDFSFISTTPSITTSGVINTVCASTTSQNVTLAYSAVAGNPTKYAILWRRGANGVLLPDQSSTLFTFAPGGGTINTIVIPANIAGGTYTGSMLIGDDECNVSQEISVTIGAGTVGGTVNGGTTITSGNASGLLTLSGHTGSVVKWQSAVSPFTAWGDIANTNTTYTSGALIATTQFRAVVQNGTCAVVNAAVTTVTVEALPTIALSPSTDEICSDLNGQELNTALSYSGTTGSPKTYSIVWNSSPANNFAAVTDAALPSSPISIVVPGGAVGGIYTGTLTVKTASGSVSLGSVFTVKVKQSPSLVTTNIIRSISTKTVPQLARLPYSGIIGNPTSYSILWSDRIIPAQNDNVFAFLPGGGFLDNIQIPENIPAGTYTGVMYLHNADNCYGVSFVSIVIRPAERETFSENSTAKTVETNDHNSIQNTVSITALNKVINVDALNQNIEKVFVYDISGNLICQKEGVGNSKVVIDNLRAGNQVLVVKVVLGNKRIQTKKVLY